MKKLTLNREVVRTLDPVDLRQANGGQFNISLTGGCPSRYCTTAIDCSSWCAGPTASLKGC